jgi:hypothetical protein
MGKDPKFTRATAGPGVGSPSTKHLLKNPPAALMGTGNGAACGPTDHFLKTTRVSAARIPVAPDADGAPLKPNPDVIPLDPDHDLSVPIDHLFPKDDEQSWPGPDESAEESPSTGHLFGDDETSAEDS